MLPTLTSTRHLLKFRALLLLTAGVMLLGTAIPAPVPRAVLVLPLALTVPGLSLLVALRVPSARLMSPPFLALAVACSMAFYPLVVLTLNALHFRLGLGSVLVATAAFTVAMVLVSLARSRDAALSPSATEDATADVVRERRGGTAWAWWTAATLSVCLALIAAGITLLPKAPLQPYTQMSLGGSWAGLTGPVAVRAGSTVTVPVAVRGANTGPTRYLLTSVVDGIPNGPVREVHLTKRGTWSGSVRLKVPIAGCLHQLVSQLESTTTHSVVAQVDAWLKTNRSCPK